MTDVLDREQCERLSRAICPACNDQAVELSGSLCGIPFAVRELCDVCGGSGLKPLLTVGELLASIMESLERGELSEHHGVELYEVLPNGFRTVDAAAAWRLPTAEGTKLVLEAARFWACSCGREGVVSLEVQRCECGLPLTVDTQGRPLR